MTARRQRPERELGGESPTPDAQSAIPIGTLPALIVWFVAWGVAYAITAPAAVLLVGGDLSNMTPWVAVIALLAQWATFLVAIVIASRQFGTGAPWRDVGARMRPIDLVGLPAGVFTQLAVLPLLYWPLRQLWPDAFSPEALEERSRSLIGGAGGVALVALSVCAIVGAPLVEELVYRGLVQRSMSRRLGGVGAWVVTSALFAAVHVSPVDFLGLFVAGLVFGLGVLLTGRIGFGVFAHIGFNGFAMAILIATR